MKQTFLEALADEIERAPGGSAGATVVLPTKRAGVHLRRVMATRVKSAQILPHITTINRWMADVAGLASADALKTLFTCYESYREVLGTSAQDISQFMSWAPVLLGDFNDLDAGLIAPEKLFRDLVDYSEIEHFSFLDSPLSEKQENYRRFWKSLPKIHAKLVEKLTSEGLAYPGLMARRAADRLDGYLDEHQEGHFLFAGLNALSAAEEKLVRQLEETGRGLILFEADRYYMNRGNHHAGLFLRRYEKAGLGKMVYTAKPLDERPLDVHICAASDKLDQANAVAALLREHEYAPQDTAVILADESMVVPVLQRLPENIEAVNVTMGLPLSNGSFADWLEHWFDLHETARWSEKEGLTFQRNALSDLFDHPFSQLLQTGIELPPSKSYVPAQAMAVGDPILKAALQPVEKNDGLDLQTAAAMMQLVFDHCTVAERPTLEQRLAALGAKRMMETMTRLARYAEATNLNVRALRSVLGRAIHSGSLSLVGEPLEGLQVMGVLEARGLGFKRVILCSADEDSLPGKSSIDSFIPFDIRNHHGMPGRREKESIYAYQFYRLLQNAERFDAVYHTDADDLTGGEMSRYLLQLKYELTKRNKNIRQVRTITDRGRMEMSSPDLTIEKSTEVLAAIENYVTKSRLSASSINRYLDSPLEWYYSYVLRLQEPEVDELSPADFGTIVHDTFEALYKPYLGKIITEEALKTMADGVDDILAARCAELAPTRDFERGVDHIHFRTAQGMVKRFIAMEKKAVGAGDKIEYLESEKVLKRTLVLDLDGKRLEVDFVGYADRVERRNDTLRIIDYKTGSVKHTDLTCMDLTRENLAKKPKALQLLMYEWMADVDYPGTEIQSQIVSLPALSRKDLFLKVDHTTKYERLEEVLSEIVREMLNPAFPIVANPDFKYAVFE